MITYRTYEQLTPVCDNVSARPSGKLSQSVSQLLLLCILQNRQLSLERAPMVYGIYFQSYICPEVNGGIIIQFNANLKI